MFWVSFPKLFRYSLTRLKESSERLGVSVLWYEIAPCSNRACAYFMVLAGVNLRMLDAACCKVEVVKGARGFDSLSSTTDLLTNTLFASAIASATALSKMCLPSSHHSFGSSVAVNPLGN